FFFDPLDDFGGWVAVGEFGFGGDPRGLEFGAYFLQIGGIFGDFPADCIGAVGSGGPPVGDVEQDEAAVGEIRELFDVFDDGAVGAGAVQGYEDSSVHGV